MSFGHIATPLLPPEDFEPVIFKAPPTLSKNEYLALELSKVWFNNTHNYYTNTLMDGYFNILKRLEKGE